MAIVALSVQPYAVANTHPRKLARALGLAFADLTSLERGVAERLGESGEDAVMTVCTSPLAMQPWRLTAGQFAARLRELALEAALDDATLINGWTAVPTLRKLSHVVTVRLEASEDYRASVLQSCLHYRYVDSALMDLASEDALLGRFSANVLGETARQPDEADLTIDTERVSPATYIDLIKRLADDPRYSVTAKTEDIINRRLLELR